MRSASLIAQREPSLAVIQAPSLRRATAASCRVWGMLGRPCGPAKALFVWALLCLATSALPGDVLDWLGGVRSAVAGIEEFSTFDIETQEEDDESLLDHYLTRPPHSWRSEWERAPQAIRTSQGCLTSGQWFIDTDLKLRAPLGNRARFGLDLRQSESDAATYNYLDFLVQFPTRYGTPGARFRPLYDKSRQDLAFTWDAGADTTALQVEAAFTFEDVFNNLWAFRQSRVGNESEPYEKRPYEPGLRVVTRYEGGKAEFNARYLTPSRKRVLGVSDGAPSRLVTLWGTLGYAALEARALGFDWEARGHNQQASSTDRPDPSSYRGRNFRRAWSVELAMRRSLPWRLAAEARWLYQDRDQSYGPPLGPGKFEAIDRLLATEAIWSATPVLDFRLGGLFDRISVAHEGLTTRHLYGTRTESRAYVGLIARFNRVSMSVVEGIELDPEPYDVWWVHDKGFFHLQTTF
jgi:hypothetical protein